MRVARELLVDEERGRQPRPASGERGERRGDARDDRGVEPDTPRLQAHMMTHGVPREANASVGGLGATPRQARRRGRRVDHCPPAEEPTLRTTLVTLTDTTYAPSANVTMTITFTEG